MTLADLINLQPGENVVLKLRRHWLIFFSHILMIFVLALVPLGAGYLILGIKPDWINGLVGRPALVLLASAYYLNIWLFALSAFTDYYLDAWLVTDQRIIDIRQQGLFARTVAELELQRVQDITSEVKGIIPSIFNFGYVYVQTAAEKERFSFEQIPNAHNVRHVLMELVDKNREIKPAPTKAVYNPLNPT